MWYYLFLFRMIEYPLIIYTHISMCLCVYHIYFFETHRIIGEKSLRCTRILLQTKGCHRKYISHIGIDRTNLNHRFKSYVILFISRSYDWISTHHLYNNTYVPMCLSYLFFETHRITVEKSLWCTRICFIQKVAIGYTFHT